MLFSEAASSQRGNPERPHLFFATLENATLRPFFQQLGKNVLNVLSTFNS